MKVLLEFGADPNAFAYKGFALLHLAIYSYTIKFTSDKKLAKNECTLEYAEKLMLLLLR